MARSKSLLSIVIISLNEERHIGRCLESLRFKIPFEVIVVDARSLDQTVAIARKRGAKVFIRAWKGFSDQKNWALSKAQGDWILSLDADEELTPGLISALEKTLASAAPETKGISMRRRNYFLGLWIRYCHWWPDVQLRLLKNGSGRFNSNPVHEGLEIRGREIELKEAMNHHSIDSLSQYLDKIQRYSTLDVQAMAPKKKKHWRYYLAVAPFLTFWREYVSRRGFLHGWHGFVLCGLIAFHDFCKYAKLWEKEILKPHG